MGYIKNIDLLAFLTQKGKKYMVGPDRSKFLITHFSLGDPDVDYLLASSTTRNTIGTKNILGDNFIPNLTGINGGVLCLRYLSDGIQQRSTLGGEENSAV